jgi:hypothetical protein
MLKLFAIFTLLFYIGILLSRDPDYFTGRITQGTIVSIGKKYVPGIKGHDGTVEPFPIVAYTANGQPYQLADKKSTYLIIGTISDHVKIIYDPKNPTNSAMLYSFAYWTSIAVFFLYFLMMVIISIAYLYITRDGPFAE